METMGSHFGTFKHNDRMQPRDPKMIVRASPNGFRISFDANAILSVNLGPIVLSLALCPFTFRNVEVTNNTPTCLPTMLQPTRRLEL